MSQPGASLKVLVVDDHDIVRIGVRQLLADRTQVVEAGNLRDAQALLAAAALAAPFQLLLLDLGLGDTFSLGSLPLLRAEHPALKIVVLTSMAEDLYAERTLRAGADGYVMKSAVVGQLLQAVDTVLAGQVYVSPELGRTLLQRLARGPAAGTPQPELSPREMEVLRLVADGKSTREIADALNRSVKTIETHKQALKTKLGAESPAMLVRLALARCGHAG